MNEMGLTELKEKQKETIMKFVRGHDTLVALPNGYGKPITYAILSLVLAGMYITAQRRKVVYK